MNLEKYIEKGNVYMKNKGFLSFLLLIVLALFLAACGGDDAEPVEEEETTEEAQEETENTAEDTEEENGAEEDDGNSEEAAADRELLELSYGVTEYDAENNALHLSLDTNLPEGTEIYRVLVQDEEETNVLVEYEYPLEDEIVFSLEGVDKSTLTGKDLQLIFEFNVTERTNSDLYEDKSLGGSFTEMEEAYQDSDQVVVNDLGAENTYSVTLTSSNTEVISEDFFPEDAEEDEE